MNTVDAAFVELLDGFLVGVARKPTNGGWQGAPGASTFAAYVMVTPGVGTPDGTITVADSQIDRDYQVTCVAATPDGASSVADAVAVAVSGQRITTDTRVTSRPISIRRYGPVEPDDTVQPAVFMVAHIFSVDTVPA